MVFNHCGITIHLLGRLSLGAVYFYFGFLKLFPGLSPGEALVGETIGRLSFGLMPASVSVPLLGFWEVVMGIMFFAGLPGSLRNCPVRRPAIVAR